jgi:hypothetical protein
VLVSRHNGMDITEVSPSARSAVEERVSAALSILAQLSSTWFSFVSTATARIVALSSFHADGGSASWPAPGTTILISVEHPKRHTVDLISEFIHEAVHHTVHMVEASCPIYSWVGLQPNEFSVVSPWTGNVLPRRSYIHALFVWHTHYCAWTELDLRSAGLDAERIALRIREARDGLQTIALHGVDDLKAEVPEGYWDSAQRLRSYWCENFGY